MRKTPDCRHFSDEPPQSRHICHLDMGGDAPDYSGMNKAAEANAAISKEALDWYKQMYAEQAPMREQAAQRALEVSDAQLASMRQNDDISQDYWDYQKNTFRPLEEKVVADAQDYDTEARREQKAGEAVADVEAQLAGQMAQQQRGMTRMGVNPTSGAFQQNGNAMSLAAASAKAGAAGQARNQVELQGYARKMDAANLGRNLASSQATSAGVALNAGNSAAQTGQMPMTQAQSAASQMGQGFNTAIQGNQSAANIYGQVAQNQTAANNASGSALGSLAGSAMMAFAMSDEDEKTDREAVEPTVSLSAIRKLPDSESWRYRKDSPANDGGQAHVGPMAQDVRATLGDGVAPGGKAIDLISMNGHLTNAVKALDKKVARLENHINKG